LREVARATWACPPEVRSGVTFNTDAISDATLITELQQFASDIREIDAEARQLRVLVPGQEWIFSGNPQ